MLEQLTCPSCSAPLQRDQLQSGERIIACPYCGNTIELPEDRKEKLKAVLGALAESNFLGGLTANAPANAKVQTNVSVISLSDEAKADLKKQIDQSVEAFNIKIPAGSASVTFTAKQSGEIPQNIKDMLAKMGIPLPNTATIESRQPKPEEKDAETDPNKSLDTGEPNEPVMERQSDQPAKKSFWKRLRGK